MIDIEVLTSIPQGEANAISLVEILPVKDIKNTAGELWKSLAHLNRSGGFYCRDNKGRVYQAESAEGYAAYLRKVYAGECPPILYEE